MVRRVSNRPGYSKNRLISILLLFVKFNKLKSSVKYIFIISAELMNKQQQITYSEHAYEVYILNL